MNPSEPLKQDDEEFKTNSTIESPSKYKFLTRKSVDKGPLEGLALGSKNLVNSVLHEQKEEGVKELEDLPSTKHKSSWRFLWFKRSASSPNPSRSKKKKQQRSSQSSSDSDDDNDEVEDSPQPRLTKSGEITATESVETERKAWWSKWASYIKYSIISKETEDAIYEIASILKTFFKDMGLKPIDLTMCLMLLNTYHTSMVSSVHTDLIVHEVPLLETLYHYMKYASAAYGWKLVYGYQWKKSAKGLYEGVKKKDKANRKILMELTGISAEDIIVTKWRSEHFHPGHFMAVDHKHKAVVLSIRGTFHTKDAMTDLIAKYEPFMGGYAHAGILMAAKKKFNDLMPLILETLKKNPDYELVIVGHSLGAGTAALLSVLIYNEYNLRLRCFAFGCPPVLSLELAHRVRSFITTVVLNDDVICRISYGSLEDLKKVIMNLMSQTDSNTQRLFQFLSAGNNLGESITKRLSSYFGCAPKPDLGTNKIVLSPRLYPPGTVYHIFDSSNRRGLLAKYDTIEESDPSLFGDILISSAMFRDHMPNAYEIALESLFNTESTKQPEVTTTFTPHKTAESVVKEVLANSEI